MSGFERFDEVEVPDQWADIGRRSELGAIGGLPSTPTRRMRRTVVVAATAAALVVGTVGSLVLLSFDSGRVGPTDSTSASESPGTSLAPEIASPPSPSSTPSSAPSTRAEIPPLACSSSRELNRIRQMIGDGALAIDYDVARDLADLVGKSELVIAGTVTAVTQSDQTIFDVADVEVLAGQGVVERFGSLARGSTESRTVEGLRFVAFLDGIDSWPGGWAARPDGLVIGCAASSDVTSFDFPSDVRELSLDQLIERVRAIGQPLERPVVQGDRCPPLSAQAGRLEPSDDFVLFALPSDQPVAIQIVGEAGTTPADPFALVARFAAGSSSSAEGYALDDSIRMFPNGNGAVFVRFDDASVGLVRARGLTENDIQTIVDALTPLPPDSEFPGFLVNDATGRFDSLHQRMSNEVTGWAGVSECSIVDTESGFDPLAPLYRVAVLTGDPIYQYASVIDRPPPLEVAMRGDAVIIISGLDDPSAIRAAEIVNADPDAWNGLLAATPQPDG
jgi:hypothetical protein